MKARYELNRDKFLTDEEQKHLLDALDVNNRNELFILLALKTGARQSELLALRPIDINEESETIFIKGLKDSNNREMPISKELIKGILKQIKDRNISLNDRIFNFSRMKLWNIWVMYRPRSLKPFHSLRHTFAINLYKKFKDIMLVKTALGHRSIKNTMIYANYVYSTEELRRIVG